MFKQRFYRISLFLVVLAAATGLLVAAGLAEPAPRQDGNGGVAASFTPPAGP